MSPVLLAVPAAVSVFHVEDDPLWSATFAKAVSTWPEFRLLGSEATASAGIDRCRRLEPEVVVVDLRLPDMDGLAMISVLKALPRPPRILVYSCRRDEFALHQIATNGVEGMLWKSSDFERLLRPAIASVAAERRFFPAEVQEAIKRYRSSADAFHKILSDREQEVLRYAATGHSDAEIAAILGVSSATSHSHRANIMKKIGVHSTPKLMLWAQEKGFVSGLV